jgi:hypothetical protein
MNDNEVIIVQGLGEEDRVLLSPPEGKEQLALVRLPGSTAPKSGGDTAVGSRPLPSGPAGNAAVGNGTAANGTSGSAAPKKP